MKLTYFSYFGCGFKIKASVMHKHMMNNKKYVKNAYKYIRIFRIFKHIQRNLNNHQYALILNSHHSNIKNKLRKMIIFAYKIHMIKEETFSGGPKGGVKKKNQERESKS